MCSPLTRTLETAIHGLAPLLAKGVKIKAWNELRKTGHWLCNMGSELKIVKEIYEGYGVDFSGLEEVREYKLHDLEELSSGVCADEIKEEVVQIWC